MQDRLELLHQELFSCRICEDKLIPGPVVWGRANAKIMHISQAPSKTVAETKKPFTDKSGDKLKYEWYKINDDIFYNKDNFYIASVAHCYPGKNPSGGDRQPPRICFDTWMKREIELLDNEMYLIVGSFAARRLFPKTDFNELVFNNLTLNGKPAYVLPHPSPLNVKWFKDNPSFEIQRVPIIRKAIYDTLNLHIDK